MSETALRRLEILAAGQDLGKEGDLAALLRQVARAGSKRQHDEKRLRQAGVVVSETALQRLEILAAGQDLVKEGDSVLELAASIGLKQQRDEK